MKHPASALSNAIIENLEARQFFSATPAVIAAFKETGLVSNVAGKAKVKDLNLTNAWGLAFNPSLDVIWTANNGSGNSSVYNSDGTISSAGFYNTITIPAPAGSSGKSTPTGMIFNGSSAFSVKEGSSSGAAQYVFATEDGTISGWNYNVDPVNAITQVDRSASHAVYKGLAQATHKGASFLFATDFHNAKVSVFDAKFKSVKLASNAFVDPKLPKGFAPFGIQNVGGNLYVTYGKQDSSKDGDVRGAGNGVVDVYSYKGELIRRFAAGGTLNSPWGITQAPSSFGSLAGDVLVGNFGDGKISAFNAKTGKLVGLVGDAKGKAIVVPGLWGMTFGPTKADSNTLFFAAGPNDEADGLLGTLTATKKK